MAPMQDLESVLSRHFGRARDGDRMAALGPAHVLHESGYEVVYSRYSVSYRDAREAMDLSAEFDEDGVLVVRAGAAAAQVRDRVSRALRFLGVATRWR